ncbi:hypothetical protein EZS27_033462, partial [termite gut metagenome]
GSKFTTGWINRLPEQQNLYKRGYYDTRGVFDDYTTQSWGEKFGAGEKIYDNVSDFFQGSSIWDHNVSVAGGTKNGTFYVSASRFDQMGIIPTTGYDKTTFRINGDQKYGQLTVGANIAYSQANTDKTLTSAGLWDSGGTGTMNSVYRWSRSDDMTHYLNDDDSKYRMFAGRQDLADDIENPYWIINKNKMNDMTERVTGNINAAFKITDWWDISYRAGIDSYNTSNYNLVYPEGAVKILWQNGMMSENETRYLYMSSNLMTSLNKTFGDFDFNLLLGTATEDTKTTVNRRMGYNFEERDFFSFDNIVAANKQFSEAHNRKRMVSAYGEFRLSYKIIVTGIITVNTGTVRNIPPVCNFKSGIDIACNTFRHIVHLILIDNPIRIFNIICQILTTGKHSVFGIIIIQIVSHIITSRPTINGIHRTGTTRIPQSGTRQSFIGICLRISDIGSDGQLSVLLIAIYTESRFIVAGSWYNTHLVETRSRYIKCPVFSSAGNTYIMIPYTGSLEEITYIIIYFFSRSKLFPPRLCRIIVKNTSCIIITAFV